MADKRTLPIIDVRCRVTIPEAGSYFSGRAKARGRLDSIKSFGKGTIEAFFEEIGEAGITTAVSTSGQTPAMYIGGREMAARTTPNDLMAKLQKDHWGKFIGVAGIDAGNVLHDSMAELDRCAKMGLRVMFIEPGRSPGCDIDDRRLYPLYEKCLAHDMILFRRRRGHGAARASTTRIRGTSTRSRRIFRNCASSPATRAIRTCAKRSSWPRATKMFFFRRTCTSCRWAAKTGLNP